MQEFAFSEFGAGRYFQLAEAAQELRLRFQQDVSRIRWSATKAEIAEVLFPGLEHRASNWLDVRLNKG
ncbi:hypothetical protein GCM10008955_01450 [Deinococcus malanensis]|uniref:Uncharacterized protein n=1 Tax=Deinococcus malanensis TaxID=1706855 RepID=A0ABQ2EH57_9DEIO|nr:hypothetical protein GCM10008955_01450 [Deinococcus malanensis]